MPNTPTPEMVAIAVYIGASGQRSTYPVYTLSDFIRVPHRITMPSGEIRLLVSVEAVKRDDDEEMLARWRDGGLGAELVAQDVTQDAQDAQQEAA